MLKKIYNNIKENIDVRQNLSELRKIIKDFNKNLELRSIINDDYTVLIKLLDAEDAKTRKNAVLLLGDIAAYECLPDIFKAYLKEEQLFVKSSYLTAMQLFNCEKYVPQMKKRVEEIKETKWDEQNTKHFTEELRQLNKLIVEAEGIESHVFTGYNLKSDIILLTNRRCADITVEKLAEILSEDNASADLENAESQVIRSIKKVGAGVHFECTDLKGVLPLRTYSEILFLVPKAISSKMDAEDAAKTLVKAGLSDFLLDRHKGNGAFYFRTEVRGKMSLAEKSKFTKKFGGLLEHMTNSELVNNTSDYEVEIRFLENKQGKFNIMLKLLTIPDSRFLYRKEHLAQSIKPVDAALIMELAKDHLKEDAKVLDPFCGVGTMLIERHKRLSCNTMYGLDINSEAIDKAKINTQAARQIVHYVNRDFFTFEHEYLFDEVVTNMPFAMGRTTEQDIKGLYAGFFKKIRNHLVDNGKIIMYSRNYDMAKEFAKKNTFNIINSVLINEKDGGTLLILC